MFCRTQETTRAQLKGTRTRIVSADSYCHWLSAKTSNVACSETELRKAVLLRARPLESGPLRTDIALIKYNDYHDPP